MKKTTPFLMLFCVLIVCLTQSCKYGGEKKTPGEATVPPDTVNKPEKKIYEPKETVVIYLASVKLKDKNGAITYHLAMFDANGDFAIDSLTTMVYPEPGMNEHIKWRKINKGGIKEIKEIKYVGADEPIIFKKGMISKTDDGWDLEIPGNILEIVGDTFRIEEYIIKYVPEDSVELTVEIDPYLRVPPN